MNFYTKLALGVLGVGAIAGAWYADEHFTKKEQEEKSVSSKALNFETEKVRKVTLRNAEGVFSFQRSDGTSDWAFVEAAGATKPDQDAVNNLVSSLQTLTVETTLAGTEAATKEGASEAAAFGLSAPRATVEIGLEGDKTLSLRVGGDVTIGSESGSTFNALSAYASTPERPTVLVVGSGVVASTKKAFADFRSKIAGDFKTADVRGVVVTKAADSSRIQLSKGEKDWSITSPRELLADANNVGLFLDRWSRLRVEKVTEKAAVSDSNKESLGLAAPAATIEILGAEGKVLQKFELGMTTESMYVTMADGAVGNVDLGQFTDLVPDLKYFRDRRVMRDVSLGDVVKLRTSSGREYQKEGSNWYAVGEAAKTTAPAPAPSSAAKPADGDATPAAGSAGKTSSKDAYDVFSQWEFLVADDVVDNPSSNLADYGLSTPIARLVFGFKDGGPAPVEVLVGNRVPSNEKLVYVKRVDTPEVYAVETQWLEPLARMDGSAVGKDPQAKK